MDVHAKTTVEKPWHADFPQTKSIVDALSREELLQMLQDNTKLPGRDFLVIDLRRTDHEGGTICGSLNLPAQTLWYSLDTLYELCNVAGISLVVFYCGSSKGRGSRAAGWFQDVLNNRVNTTIKSVVLQDGINGWFRAGDEYMQWVKG